MSNQVYKNETEVYPVIETGRYLVDRFDNNRIVMEGPHVLGDLLQLKSIGSGTYEDPDVLKFRSPAEIIVDDLITTKGGLLTNDGTTAVELPVGTNRQVLWANSAVADGIEWNDLVNTKGGILTSDGVNNVELPVGVNRQLLQANSAVADGIEWTDNILCTTLQANTQIKCNNINPIGAGPIYIDGTGINIYSPSNDVEVHCGDISGAPPTDQALFHVEGNGTSGIIISAGEDGTGEPYFELQGETRSIIGNIQVDSTTDNFVLEASTQTSKSKNNLVFRVGGQFVTPPTLDNLAVPVGGVNALVVDGANANVGVLNKVVFTNGIQIGDTSTTTNSATDIIIGKGASSSTGERGTCIGNSALCNGQDSICLGTNTQTNFTGACAFGNGSTSIGATRGYAIGDTCSVTATDAWAIGKNVSNAVATSAKLFDTTFKGTLFDTQYFGSTNKIWTSLEAPYVSMANIYDNNSASYNMTAVETINGKVYNIYNVGVATLTFPSRASLITQLENYQANNVSPGTTIKTTSFKTVIINASTQAITLVAGTNQTPLGTSLSAGITANTVVVFESFIAVGSYITYRISTQAI